MLERPFARTETLMLADLHRSAMFHTPLDARFERLTRLTQKALSVPVAGITIAHEDRLWFKSVIGWNIQELRLEDSLCARTMEKNTLVVFEDTTANEDVARTSVVINPPRFRFYAGCPLANDGGSPVGTLCVYDVKPRRASLSDLEALRDLAVLVQRELHTAVLCDAQAQLLAKLNVARRQAMLDELTRVWNRRAGQELLRTAVAQAGRTNSPLAICMIDVDGFKGINDRYGHPAGDRILRKVAGTVVSSLRDGDAVCRWGGDEFLVILERTPRAEAERIADRIRNRVKELAAKRRLGIPALQVSVGVAVKSPGHTLDDEGIVALADQAMYQSKTSGGRLAQRV